MDDRFNILHYIFSFGIRNDPFYSSLIFEDYKENILD